MKAVVFEQAHTIAVKEVPDPVPEGDQVLLRPVLTGICGTDKHLLAGGFMAEYPLIPGHEIIAEVLQTHPDSDLRVGMTVAVDNTEVCGACQYCRRGELLYCENLYSRGCNAPGGFAELLVAPWYKCFDIGALTPTEAALTEPLACAIHGMDVIDLKAGSDVLLFGAGPTGLLLAQLLREAGAWRVTMAAPTQRKLDLALVLGVDQVVQIDREDPAAAIEGLRGLAPGGFDVVVDATGSPAILTECPALTRIGGTVVVYGVADEDARVPFSPYDIFERELRIQGSFAQINCFDRALMALTTGRVRTDGLITDRFGLDDFEKALEVMRDSNSIKVVIDPHGAGGARASAGSSRWH
ncbi:MAG: zinc-dependent alcohol dehydrogenase family protein [Propioniciclava sp.]